MHSRASVGGVTPVKLLNKFKKKVIKNSLINAEELNKNDIEQFSI